MPQSSVEDCNKITVYIIFCNNRAEEEQESANLIDAKEPNKCLKEEALKGFGNLNRARDLVLSSTAARCKLAGGLLGRRRG